MRERRRRVERRFRAYGWAAEHALECLTVYHAPERDVIRALAIMTGRPSVAASATYAALDWIPYVLNLPR